MNYWTKLSIEFANQRNYLDKLFCVYPTIPEGIRASYRVKWSNHYNRQNSADLLRMLLKLDLFPIKDSYVAYLKRNRGSIERNPNTIDSQPLKTSEHIDLYQ